jgi:hypothetical protein
MSREDCIAEIKQYIEGAYDEGKETEFIAAFIATLGADPDSIASVFYLAYLESVEGATGTGAVRIIK